MAKKQSAGRGAGKGAKETATITPDLLRSYAEELRGIARDLDDHATTFESLDAEPYSGQVGNFSSGLLTVREWMANQVASRLIRIATIKGKGYRIKIDHPGE